SVRSIDLIVDSNAEGVRMTVRIDGKADGAWARYVSAQRPGATWGARLVPRDAVLVYLTRRSDPATREELDASVAYLGDSALPPASAALRAAWRAALGRAAEEMDGDIVYSVWPGRDG